MNQKALGDALTKKVTFQQVQKYERGANRLSASALHECSQILHVPVSAFFPGQNIEERIVFSKDEIEIIHALRSLPEEMLESIYHLIHQSSKSHGISIPK